MLNTLYFHAIIHFKTQHVSLACNKTTTTDGVEFLIIVRLLEVCFY